MRYLVKSEENKSEGNEEAWPPTPTGTMFANEDVSVLQCRLRRSWLFVAD
jgi:hypothetical protein